VQKSRPVDAADIFGGSQSTVIDFNEIATAPASEADQKAFNQPLMKKRKITIISDAEKVRFLTMKIKNRLGPSNVIPTGHQDR